MKVDTITLDYFSLYWDYHLRSSVCTEPLKRYTWEVCPFGSFKDNGDNAKEKNEQLTNCLSGGKIPSIHAENILMWI